VTTQRSDELLILLQDAGLEFVVVGGVAAIAHGSTRSTKDLDVVAEFSEESLRVLLEALAPHHPKHLARPDLGVVSQSPKELCGHRLLLLTTDLGRLDVLREIIAVGRFPDLDTVTMELVEGRSFQVISLDQLIATKSALTRPKDKDVEAELRAIRGLRDEADGESPPEP
jgi:predicted nucleotidyltransferase